MRDRLSTIVVVVLLAVAAALVVAIFARPPACSRLLLVEVAGSPGTGLPPLSPAPCP